jgi:inorganic pyrophosphatase/exopolyphosphatase
MDHNQESQIAPTLNLNGLVGVIDHHALQNGTVITDRPIYIDIRPWGSACTIVGHTYLRIRKPIPNKIAGILLSGILSDTLNLRSPTTTDHDRLLVAVLAKISEVRRVEFVRVK